MYFESGVGTPLHHRVTVQGGHRPGRDGITVRRIPLDQGDAGVEQTIREMRRMVRNAVVEPSVKELAVLFTTGAGPVDDEAVARLLLHRLRGAFRYVRDTRDVEEIWEPRLHAIRHRQLGYTWGDCDDLAVWSGALARAVGLPVRLVAIANGKRGAAMNHVFTEVMTAPGVWRSMDFLAPNTPIVRVKRWEV